MAGIRIPYPEKWKLPPCYVCKSLRHTVQKNKSGYFQIYCSDCGHATKWGKKEDVILEWVNTYLYGHAFLLSQQEGQ